MRRLYFTGALAIAALAAPAAARAGIHNVQSILATEAEPGLSGALVGSADVRTGNTEFIFLSATPIARYRTGDHLFIGILRAEYKTSKGDTLVERVFEHLRYRYTFSEGLLGEVFAQHEFDANKRLQARALIGAGPKFQFFDNKKFGLGIGVAYMLEYERLNDGSEPDAGDESLGHRMSSYAVAHYNIDDRMQLVETVYVQPRLDDPSDFRMLSESQLDVRVTRRLSLTTAFSAAFDSEPPSSIVKLDTALKSSITYEF